jgi:hypothetical protein
MRTEHERKKQVIHEIVTGQESGSRLEALLDQAWGDDQISNIRQNVSSVHEAFGRLVTLLVRKNLITEDDAADIF